MSVDETTPSARRVELLERAYQYALSHGLGDMSLRPLAAAIGSSPRVLLFLFGSKDGLVRELLARARTFIALTEQEAGRIELDYVPAQMPEFERSERPDHFQFWRDDGPVLYRSARLRGDLPRTDAEVGTKARDVELGDGRRARVVQLSWIPQQTVSHEAEGDEAPDAGAEAGADAGVRLVLATVRLDDQVIVGQQQRQVGVRLLQLHHDRAAVGGD